MNPFELTEESDQEEEDEDEDKEEMLGLVTPRSVEPARVARKRKTPPMVFVYMGIFTMILVGVLLKDMRTTESKTGMGSSVPISNSHSHVDQDTNQTKENQMQPADAVSANDPEERKKDGNEIWFDNDKNDKTQDSEATKSDSASENQQDEKPSQRRHVYTRRARKLSEQEEAQLIETWGSWALVDDKKRASNDFYKEFTNRDVPHAKFPSNAWQLDSDYVIQFLNEGLMLVDRVREAILSEYGHGKEHSEDSFEERTKMFELDFRDNILDSTGFNDWAGEQGGWTTTKSWNGLKRRLLHAIMSEDSFVFAMGGHSAAAGHG